jgi:hypothetical protein
LVRELGWLQKKSGISVEKKKNILSVSEIEMESLGFSSPLSEHITDSSALPPFWRNA